MHINNLRLRANEHALPRPVSVNHYDISFQTKWNGEKIRKSVFIFILIEINEEGSGMKCNGFHPVFDNGACMLCSTHNGPINTRHLLRESKWNVNSCMWVRLCLCMLWGLCVVEICAIISESEWFIGWINMMTFRLPEAQKLSILPVQL